MSIIRIAPAPRQGTFAAAVRAFVGAFAVGFLLVALAACAGRAAQIHLSTAQQASNALQVADELLDGICTTERAEREGQDFVDRCHEASAAQRAAVDAHTSWTLAAGTEGLDGPAVAEHLGNLIRLYGELRSFLRLYGRDLPEVF